ncbi:MAG TPA: signal peptidase I [Spirochaetales bacterium]|nr:signal peptidase I [Spirochaetales bacterium]HPS14707.1 signal peptidase I [Spirochaetales bacterium]
MSQKQDRHKGKKFRFAKLTKNDDWEIIGIILGVILILFITKTFVLDVAQVHGKSMLPSLVEGDIVLVFKAAYGLRNPFGGYLILWRMPRNRDIVVAFKPGSESTIIKRVWIQEPLVLDQQTGIFLLGDNNSESVDSREFGPVPMSNILGSVIKLP